MFRRALLGLALMGCAHLKTEEAPIIVMPLFEGRAAQAVCSLNNMAVVVVDTATPMSFHAEFTYYHEHVHVIDMRAYPGGCWPFIYRYNRDRMFRIKAEMKAYCAEGRFAMRRNRRPDDLWKYIVDAMAGDTVLTEKDNCLYKDP